MITSCTRSHGLIAVAMCMATAACTPDILMNGTGGGGMKGTGGGGAGGSTEASQTSGPKTACGNVTTLASGIAKLAEVLLFEDTLILATATPTTGTGQILALPLSGGTPRVIASDTVGTFQPATDGTYVYWSTQVGGGNMPIEIHKHSLSGTEPNAVLIEGPSYSYFSASATTAYILQPNVPNGGIFQIPLAGGVLTPFSNTLPSPPHELLFDTEAVYSVVYTSMDTTFYKTPVQGGTSTKIATDAPNDYGRAAATVFAGNLYYSTGYGSDTKSSVTSAIRKVPLDGSAPPTTVVEGRGEYIVNVVANSTGVYWSEVNKDANTIYRITEGAGGQIEQVASGPGNDVLSGEPLVLHDTITCPNGICWLNRNGSVMRFEACSP